MTARDISLVGAVYSAVPSVLLPKSGGGQASFVEISDTTAAAADVAYGKEFYTSAGVKTQGTATSQGVSVVETTDPVAGGTIVTITATPVYPFNFKGEQCEWVSNLGSNSYALSTTTFDTWTPSTTAKAVKATANLTTFSADLANYEYIIKWETQADVAYDSGTTMNTCPIRQVACLYSYIFKRPVDLTAVGNGGRTSNSTVSYTSALTKYYNANGALAMGWTMSYGIYPAVTNPTFSSSTSNTPTVTVKTPTWNVRCSTTYMSTTAAEAIDSANTSLQQKATLYRCKVGSFARGAYEDCITLFNGG